MASHIYRDKLCFQFISESVKVFSLETFIIYDMTQIFHITTYQHEKCYKIFSQEPGEIVAMYYHIGWHSKVENCKITYYS